MSTSDIFGKLKISTRVIAAGLFITALFVLFTYVWLLPAVENTLLKKKREKIREATESAWSILAHYHRLSEQGRMEKSEAMTAAADLIRDIRYGPEMKDYFWINDLHPVMIAHPYRNDLEGKDISDFTDPKGVRLFSEFVRIAKAEGEGFLSYYWQWKDDTSQIVPKVSFVRLFRPWGWIVGTGVYTEDIRKEIHSWQIRMGTLSVALALIGVFLSWRMGRRVSRHMRQMTRPSGKPDEGEETGSAWRLQTFVLIIVIPAIVFVTILWAAALYRTLNTVIMDGFDRKLSAISRVTGCFIKGEDHEQIEAAADESSTLYQQYVQPMRRIMKTTGLTYLYTQILSKKPPGCRYILDATEGEEHSEIGFEDNLPIADYRGGERVMRYGTVHVGEVQSTENWGLLKSSFAPIYDERQRITAMAGADVNVSVINDKMRVTLFGVAALGVAALLLAAYASFFFAKRLISPLSRVKEHALAVASGQQHPLSPTDTSAALGDLSTKVDEIGSVLSALETKHENDDLALEQGRRKDDLVSVLSHHLSGRGRSCRGPGYAMRVVNGDHVARAAGCVTDGDTVVVYWQTERADNRIDAQIAASDLSLIVEKLIRTSAGDKERLLEQISPLTSFGMNALFVYDIIEKSISVLSNTSQLVQVVEAPGVMSRRIVKEGVTLRLKAGQALITGDRIPPVLQGENSVSLEAVEAFTTAPAEGDTERTGVLFGLSTAAETMPQMVLFIPETAGNP